MKKLLAIILSVTMICMIAVPVMAGEAASTDTNTVAVGAVVIAADSLGKIKTLLQMIFIPALMLGSCWPFSLLQPCYDLFWTTVVWIGVIISVVSCIRYMMNNKGLNDFHD